MKNALLLLLTLSASYAAAAKNQVSPTGLEATGAYWGGLGESIDLRSGNLNYQYPLLTARGTMWKITVPLTYNSQIWTKAAARQTRLSATDTGYGFGWKLQFGSIKPIYDNVSRNPKHYISRTPAVPPMT